MERYDFRIRVFAAGLSGLAGYVDASGFILSKGFFVSFMSGNSTRFGVGLAEQAADAAAAGGLILAFVLGVATGSLIGRSAGRHRAAAVLAAVAAMLCVASLFLAAGAVHAALALLAFAMGTENAIFEDGGKVRIGLTYMTGSLVKLGQAIAGTLVRQPRGEWLSYMLLWAGFVGGAVSGAAATSAYRSLALWGAALVAALACAMATILFRPASGSLGEP